MRVIGGSVRFAYPTTITTTLAPSVSQSKAEVRHRSWPQTPATADNQFDDRAPRVDKILKRGSDLREGVQDLVHRTECDLASNDRWSEQDVGKDDVGLQINDAADIEYMKFR